MCVWLCVAVWSLWGLLPTACLKSLGSSHTPKRHVEGKAITPVRPLLWLPVQIEITLSLIDTVSPPVPSSLTLPLSHSFFSIPLSPLYPAISLFLLSFLCHLSLSLSLPLSLSLLPLLPFSLLLHPSLIPYSIPYSQLTLHFLRGPALSCLTEADRIWWYMPFRGSALAY